MPPATLPSAYDVALQETDPQFGPEAALSAFDATFSMSGQFQHNDQQVNNTFVGNNGYFAQSYDVMQAQLEKRAVTGSEFTLRQIIDYNRDTNLGDQYSGGNWDAILEAEVRHPLLQGSGIEFNRIAGPGGKPGVYNGVLVARIRTDISIADFEIGLRDYVTNVEDAYWDLYFAYRDLDVKIKARDLALETWRNSRPSTRAENRAAKPRRKPRPASSTSASRKTSRMPWPAGRAKRPTPTTARRRESSARFRAFRSPSAACGC